MRRKKNWNEDRHACKTCVYRSSSSKNNCDYIVIMEHSRGCDVENCKRYQEDKFKGKAKEDGIEVF